MDREPAEKLLDEAARRIYPWRNPRIDPTLEFVGLTNPADAYRPTQTTQGDNLDMSHRLPLRVLLAVAAVAGAFAVAPTANAGLLVASAPSCAEEVLEQPFKRWLDPLRYHVVPGGTFEQGAPGWSLSSNAKVVDGNESFNVHGAGERKSLSLPAGSTATTPVMCARLDKPVMRFFAKSSGGLLSLSTLAVEVLFETRGGQVASLPAGVVLPNTKWQPTLPLPVLASLLALLPGEQTPVAFRFRPIGSASWNIDDVYFDPGRR